MCIRDRLTTVQTTIAIDENIHKWILYNKDTFNVPPKIIPTIRKTGLSNFVENSILKLVKAMQRFKPKAPSNQGKGRPIRVPI